MPRNGSGTYSKPAGTTAVAGQRATASKFNELEDDIATALTDSLSRTGKGGMLAALGMGGFGITNLGTPSVGSDAATKTYADGLQGTTQNVARGQVSWGGTAAGTADALTISLTPTLAAYANGMVVRFVAGSTNTGAATLNVNTVGAIAFRRPDGTTALSAGDIVAGTVVEAVYESGSPNRFRLIRQQQPARPTLQKFTASGTWNRPAGCTKIKVTLVAPGGGGGGADGASGSDNGVGGGGGGGGWSIKYIDVTSIASAGVTIGTAGAAGVDSGGNGGAGGTTSFGTGPLLQATGGAGGGGIQNSGSNPARAGGAGGVGSLGDVNGVGAPGATGFVGGGSNVIGGNGGASMFGGGGAGALRGSSGATAGGAGGDYGGGGGGAASNSTSTGAAGGAGGAGVVYVEEFY